MFKKKPGQVSIQELIKQNKEELLNNKEELAKIEKRLDEKHITTK